MWLSVAVSRRKNKNNYFKALDLIGKPVKVILVGIQEDEELKKIRENLKLPHQIFYEGEKEGAYALNYYKIFTCTVLCSTIEGLSQGLLESMYLGKPVIATAAAGNLDFIKHNENRFTF
ncbi:MAG: glycosyltransferase [Cytophagales bacterium]|nr:glycosyltransferase [Cytophagales bacterium]